MSNLELFRIWAPQDRVWSQWAKPVLFAQNELLMETPETSFEWPSLNLPNDRETALIVDLPRDESIRFGIAAARIGYWPVPLFNCAFTTGAVLDVRPMFRRLQAGAEELTRTNVPQGAPPAFLVDSKRLDPDTPLFPGSFDNRYIMLPQDFPSAGFLKAHGIRRALWTRTPPGEIRWNPAQKEDLAHVLRRWQEGGIEIFEWHLGDSDMRRINVPKPSMFRSIFHRAMATMGLRRNSAGGFGGVLPQPSSGGWSGG
jgi:hypothetical protein